MLLHLPLIKIIGSLNALFVVSLLLEFVLVFFFHVVLPLFVGLDFSV